MGELQVNCGDMKFPEKSVGPITHTPARQSPLAPSVRLSLSSGHTLGHIAALIACYTSQCRGFRIA